MPAKEPLPAVDAAMRILARRSLTSKELTARLAAKGYAQAETGEACERLASWGYLDDRAVAEFAVAECLERRPRGRDLLRAELAQRGVAAEAIEEALGLYPPAREQETALRALARLGLRPPLASRDRPRAWRALARLGFAEPTLERLCGFPDP